MRSYRLTGPGPDGLQIRTEPVPVPKAGEVPVRMRAASLNYRDLFISRLYPIDADHYVPLSDGAGEVVEVGADVRRFAVGDRVAGCFHPNWLYGPIPRDWTQDAMGGGIVIEGGGTDGVLTEYRTFREDAAILAPAGLTSHETATLPCAGLTAWNAMLGVQAEDSVLILGTGGVSIFALQFAKAAGARVIATSSSDEKIARLRAMGADETINYRREPDWEKAVLELTGGRGVDRVIEVGGAGTMEKSILSTVPGGEVALIGILTEGRIDPTLIMSAGVNVRPIVVGSRQMFEAMNRRIEQHAIRPVVDRVFPFEQAPDAYRYLEAAGHYGKVVVDIP